MGEKKNMSVIIGVSAYYHDSAAVLLVDGEIIAAAQEERFTRIKHTPDFPVNAIKYCLEHSGYSLDELDAVVFYDKPLLKFERLLETYYAFAPRGLRQFIKSIPVWLREKMFLKKLIYEGLSEVATYDQKKLNLLFSEHHLSHAASAFYPSPYNESAILTIDGVGEWATATISHGTGSTIKILKEMRFPHSVGLLYSAFTYYLGFRVNSGEYKLMGLAPYGNPAAVQTDEFIKLIKQEIVSINDDGSIWLNQNYFNYSTGLKMVNDKRWERLFGFPAVEPDGELSQAHCNLAYAIQKVTEEIVIKMAKEAKKLTGAKYLCMAGGVALNCVANGQLLREKIFEDIFIQPAAGDAGGALGAAQIVNYMYYKQERKISSNTDSMHGAYLGPDFSDKESIIAFKKHKAVFTRFDDYDEMCDEVANMLDKGNVIGWFQGRMEFGPRALGNRSILGDPRNKEMQKKLNLKIKYREGFRPFAPSVLIECSNEYFDLPVASPYMLLIANVNDNRRKPLPDNYDNLDLWDRLYHERSDVQSITHLDFSARIQTVHRETNPRYWQLINTFKKKTGYGIVVNTSFNVRGEPIVCTPEDAYKCFMRTEMDYLVINNFFLRKTDQPDWKNREKWIVKYKRD
jgi:carbamoyltransferase